MSCISINKLLIPTTAMVLPFTDILYHIIIKKRIKNLENKENHTKNKHYKNKNIVVFAHKNTIPNPTVLEFNF